MRASSSPGTARSASQAKALLPPPPLYRCCSRPPARGWCRCGSGVDPLSLPLLPSPRGGLPSSPGRAISGWLLPTPVVGREKRSLGLEDPSRLRNSRYLGERGPRGRGGAEVAAQRWEGREAVGDPTASGRGGVPELCGAGWPSADGPRALVLHG